MFGMKTHSKTTAYSMLLQYSLRTSPLRAHHDTPRTQVHRPWRRLGVADKTRKTRCDKVVRALSFEVYGRMGRQSSESLIEAKQVRSGEGASALTRRWHRDKDLAIACAQAESMLAARGTCWPALLFLCLMVNTSTADGGECLQACNLY